MTRRHLIIVHPSPPGKKRPIHVQIDDQTPIGPWIITLAIHFRYPLVDHFGYPIAYRLRSLSDERILPTTGLFADTRLSSGSRFILEPDIQEPISEYERPPFFRLSRRSLINCSALAAFSLLGFGSGVTTALAQHKSHQPGTHVVNAHQESDLFTLTIHTTFTQHQQTVRTVSWSPDEHMLASGGNDQFVLVWRPDETILHTLQCKAAVRGVAWSPDGKQLAVGAANALSFYETNTGSLLTENTEQHTAPIAAVAWTGTPIPFAISAGTDKRAVVWNGQSHQPHSVFQQHTTAIEALATLTDTVATASQGGVVRVWNANDAQEIHGYYMDTQRPLRAIAFASTGTLATGRDDSIINLWKAAQTCTRQMPDTFGLHCIDEPVRLQGQTHPIRALAFSPDGTLLATGGDDKQLVIWSISKATPLLIQPQQDVLEALSWSSSGRFLAGALGSHVCIWQIPQEMGRKSGN